MKYEKYKDFPVNLGGIILSLFITLAVWGFVVFLIGNNEKELLKNKTVNENILLLTSEAVRTEPYITAETFEIGTSLNNMIGNVLKYLADGEMTEWQESKARVPKSAAEEKMSDFISYLTECGFLNSSEYTYDMTLYGPAFGEAGFEPEPYTFWKGSAVSSDYTVAYTMNADGGRVWYAEITSNNGAFEFSGIIPEELLSAYEVFLGYPTSHLIYHSENSAYRVYGNSFVSNAVVDGNKLIMRLLPY